jgi:hypothetical protein
MANKNPETGPLLKSIENKKAQAFQKVENTIKEMIRTQQKINFNSVAQTSGVSKSFLYKYSEVRSRIETLRKQEEGLDNPKLVKRKMTEKSKDVIIASLQKRNKDLEEENKRLKQQLKIDWAEIYKQID